MGLFHGRIAAFTARRRHLRIDAAGIRIRGRFRRFFTSWTDLERADLQNAQEVREALLKARKWLAPAQGF